MVVAGLRFIQWISLFDHPDDEVYDGVLGEDDEEMNPGLLEDYSESAPRESDLMVKNGLLKHSTTQANVEVS
jgi:hypothetical protein